MAENENMVVNQIPPEEQAKASLGKRIWAGIKEWGRKQIVALKRYPHRIPLAMLVITSLLWLFWLFTFSRSVDAAQSASWTGIAVFANTLLSILILPLFLNAFPKRKPANKIFIALVFIFMAAIVLLDVVYYVQSNDYIVNYLGNAADRWLETYSFFTDAMTLSIVHIVLIGVCALLLALMPLYTPLIRKINTSKNIEGNDIHETIDVEDE